MFGACAMTDDQAPLPPSVQEAALVPPPSTSGRSRRRASPGSPPTGTGNLRPRLASPAPANSLEAAHDAIDHLRRELAATRAELEALRRLATPAVLPMMFLRPSAKMPRRGSLHAAGLNLFAAIPEPLLLWPGERHTIPTEIAVALPAGHYGRLAPRSGLAVHLGIDVSAGVIDADYRGELSVLVSANGRLPFQVRPGDRIAQLIVESIAAPVPTRAKELPSTARGPAGFGSTGISDIFPQDPQHLLFSEASLPGS